MARNIFFGCLVRILEAVKTIVLTRHLVSLPQMVASSSMDGESVALLRDYVNELLQCVSSKVAQGPMLTTHLQVDGEGKEPDICARIRKRKYRIPKHLAVMTLTRHALGCMYCPRSALRLPCTIFLELVPNNFFRDLVSPGATLRRPGDVTRSRPLSSQRHSERCHHTCLPTGCIYLYA